MKLESAMAGRIPISPNHVIGPKPDMRYMQDFFDDPDMDGDKPHFCSGPYNYRSMIKAVSMAPPAKGPGLLDMPVKEKTAPVRDSDFDVRKTRKIAPPYRVLLHNDNFNKREYVVKVLMKVIPGMTLDNAVNIMQEAHQSGMSVVIICGQADAEQHCKQLRGNGLLSSIEPASRGGC